MPRHARAAEVERPTRSGPARAAATPHATTRATTADPPRAAPPHPPRDSSQRPHGRASGPPDARRPALGDVEAPPACAPDTRSERTPWTGPSGPTPARARTSQARRRPHPMPLANATSLAGDPTRPHRRPAPVGGRARVAGVNLALARGPAPATFFLLRRALEAGTRPEAIVVDFKPSVLVGSPRYNPLTSKITIGTLTRYRRQLN